MIAWAIVGILGVIAAWVLLALAESILRLILSLIRKPDP